MSRRRVYRAKDGKGLGSTGPYALTLELAGGAGGCKLEATVERLGHDEVLYPPEQIQRGTAAVTLTSRSRRDAARGLTLAGARR